MLTMKNKSDWKRYLRTNVVSLDEATKALRDTVVIRVAREKDKAFYKNKIKLKQDAESCLHIDELDYKQDVLLEVLASDVQYFSSNAITHTPKVDNSMEATKLNFDVEVSSDWGLDGSHIESQFLAIAPCCNANAVQFFRTDVFEVRMNIGNGMTSIAYELINGKQGDAFLVLSHALQLKEKNELFTSWREIWLARHRSSEKAAPLRNCLIFPSKKYGYVQISPVHSVKAQRFHSESIQQFKEQNNGQWIDTRAVKVSFSNHQNISAVNKEHKGYYPSYHANLSKVSHGYDRERVQISKSQSLINDNLLKFPDWKEDKYHSGHGSGNPLNHKAKETIKKQIRDIIFSCLDRFFHIDDYIDCYEFLNDKEQWLLSQMTTTPEVDRENHEKDSKNENNSQLKQYFFNQIKQRCEEPMSYFQSIQVESAIDQLLLELEQKL